MDSAGQSSLGQTHVTFPLMVTDVVVMAMMMLVVVMMMLVVMMMVVVFVVLDVRTRPVITLMRMVTVVAVVAHAVEDQGAEKGITAVGG